MSSQAMDRTLSLGELLPWQLHLAMCPTCARYRRQLHAMRRILGAGSDDFSSPDPETCPPGQAPPQGPAPTR